MLYIYYILYFDGWRAREKNVEKGIRRENAFTALS